MVLQVHDRGRHRMGQNYLSFNQNAFNIGFGWHSSFSTTPLLLVLLCRHLRIMGFVYGLIIEIFKYFSRFLTKFMTESVKVQNLSNILILK